MKKMVKMVTKRTNKIEVFYNPVTNKTLALRKTLTNSTERKALRAYSVLALKGKTLVPTKETIVVRNNHESLQATYGLVKVATL